MCFWSCTSLVLFSNSCWFAVFLGAVLFDFWSSTSCRPTGYVGEQENAGSVDSKPFLQRIAFAMGHDCRFPRDPPSEKVFNLLTPQTTFLEGIWIPRDLQWMPRKINLYIVSWQVWAHSGLLAVRRATTFHAHSLKPKTCNPKETLGNPTSPKPSCLIMFKPKPSNTDPKHQPWKSWWRPTSSTPPPDNPQQDISQAAWNVGNSWACYEKAALLRNTIGS